MSPPLPLSVVDVCCGGLVGVGEGDVGGGVDVTPVLVGGVSVEVGGVVGTDEVGVELDSWVLV